MVFIPIKVNFSYKLYLNVMFYHFGVAFKFVFGCVLVLIPVKATFATSTGLNPKMHLEDATGGETNPDHFYLQEDSSLCLRLPVTVSEYFWNKLSDILNIS